MNELRLHPNKSDPNDKKMNELRLHPNKSDPNDKKCINIHEMIWVRTKHARRTSVGLRDGLHS